MTKTVTALTAPSAPVAPKQEPPQVSLFPQVRQRANVGSTELNVAI